MVGPPAMLLDRWLNESRSKDESEALVGAWCAAMGPEADSAWAPNRRAALLLEAIRFDDELAHLDPDAPVAVNLSTLIRSQLDRLLEHARKTAKS